MNSDGDMQLGGLVQRMNRLVREPGSKRAL